MSLWSEKNYRTYNDDFALIPDDVKAGASPEELEGMEVFYTSSIVLLKSDAVRVESDGNPYVINRIGNYPAPLISDIISFLREPYPVKLTPRFTEKAGKFMSGAGRAVPLENPIIDGQIDLSNVSLEISQFLQDAQNNPNCWIMSGGIWNDELIDKQYDTPSEISLPFPFNYNIDTQRIRVPFGSDESDAMGSNLPSGEFYFPKGRSYHQEDEGATGGASGGASGEGEGGATGQTHLQGTPDEETTLRIFADPNDDTRLRSNLPAYLHSFSDRLYLHAFTWSSERFVSSLLFTRVSNSDISRKNGNISYGIQSGDIGRALYLHVLVSREIDTTDGFRRIQRRSDPLIVSSPSSSEHSAILSIEIDTASVSLTGMLSRTTYNNGEPFLNVVYAWRVLRSSRFEENTATGMTYDIDTDGVDDYLFRQGIYTFELTVTFEDKFGLVYTLTASEDVGYSTETNDVIVRVGNRLTLNNTLTVVGVPNPVFTYVWFKNGIDLNVDGDEYILASSDIGGDIFTVEISYFDRFGVRHTSTALPYYIDRPSMGLPVIIGANIGSSLIIDITNVTDPDTSRLSIGDVRWFDQVGELNLIGDGRLFLNNAYYNKRISAEVSVIDSITRTTVKLTTIPTDPIQYDDVSDFISVVGLNQTGDNGRINIQNDVEFQFKPTTELDLDDFNRFVLTVYDGVIIENDGQLSPRITSRISQDDINTLPLYVFSASASALLNKNLSFGLSLFGTDKFQSFAIGILNRIHSYLDDISGDVIITGREFQNESLNADTSSVIDSIGEVTDFTFKWFRDGNLTDTTTSSYPLGEVDVGSTIHVVASYTDSEGIIRDLTRSTSTGTIADVDDPVTGEVTIDGNLVQRDRLTANVSDLDDLDGALTNFTYQWLRDGSPLIGQTSITYVLTQDDVGNRISVRANFIDGNGNPMFKISSQTNVIADFDDPVTGSVSITGTRRQYQTLTVDTSQLNDLDGPLSNFRFQWSRNGSPLIGETSITYVLTQDDVGSVVSVFVRFNDGNGNLASRSASVIGITDVDDPVTGGVVIDGNAVQYGLLVANTSTLSDLDGPVVVTGYQWLRGASIISNANARTYSLTQADVGNRISTRVFVNDGNGVARQFVSTQTSIVQDVNDPVVGIVFITGARIQTSTLTGDVSGLIDPDGPITDFTYRWLRNGVPISNATNQSYVLTQVDVNQRISFITTFTDFNGVTGTRTSTQTQLIQNIDDPITGDLELSGGNTQNQAIGVDVSNLNDLDGPLRNFTYQWLRNNFNISGANNSTYLLTQDDVGNRISVRVGFVDTSNNSHIRTSPLSDPIRDFDDPVSGSVFIQGQTIQYSRLSVSIDQLRDPDGPLSQFTYQWFRDSEIVGTLDTYPLTEDDIGSRIRVLVTFLDGNGNSRTASSPLSGVVADADDRVTGFIGILGTRRQGQTLSADVSNLRDPDGPITNFTYQWRRNGSNISGARNSTYTLIQTDVGTSISLFVTYREFNPQGANQTGSRLSGGTGSIEDRDDPVEGFVAISGTIRQNEVLTANTSNLRDPDGEITNFTYQWIRDDREVIGATNATYTLTQADVGLPISLRVGFTDANGTVDSRTTPNTIAVVDVDDPVIGNIYIDGIVQVGRILTLNIRQLRDPDGDLNITSIVWRGLGQTFDNGFRYLIGSNELNNTISVTLNYIDANGNSGTITSSETTQVIVSALDNSPINSAIQVGTTVRGFGVGELEPTDITSSGNRIFMVGTSLSKLLTINPNNGIAVAPRGASGFGVDENLPSGLEEIDGVLYLLGAQTQKIYTLNTTTGLVSGEHISLNQSNTFASDEEIQGLIHHI